MILKGTVRNVIDFGVFVDIGVHQDGLVHISEITDKKFIKHCKSGCMDLCGYFPDPGIFLLPAQIKKGILKAEKNT